MLEVRQNITDIKRSKVILDGSKVPYKIGDGLQIPSMLDFPIFSFEDHLPGTPCPESLIDLQLPLEMELYDTIIDGDKKPTVSELFSDGQLFDLDPTFENSIDFQELISHVHGKVTTDFPVTDVSDIDLLQAEDQSFDSTVVENDGEVDAEVPSVISIEGDSNSAYMLSSEDIVENCGWSITIKSEESEEPRPSCQGTPSTLDQARLTTPTRRGTPGRKPSAAGAGSKRKRQVEKDTDEYQEKRSRNNVAVRKSREKAKIKQCETEDRVQALASENEQLQKKVDLLSKELHVLKSLFINVGAALPANFDKIMSEN